MSGLNEQVKTNIDGVFARQQRYAPVSYTHLTLPTSDLV